MFVKIDAAPSPENELQKLLCQIKKRLLLAIFGFENVYRAKNQILLLLIRQHTKGAVVLL